MSSCLLGLNTRYDGLNNNLELLEKYSHLGKFVPICPEQLGGLATPREPVEIKQGTGKDVLEGNSKVLSISNEDKTANFLRATEEIETIFNKFPIKAAILKESSPSCGVNNIYDGTFSNKLRSGNGVSAAFIKKYNIPVYSEKELTEEILIKLLND